MARKPAGLLEAAAPAQPPGPVQTSQSQAQPNAKAAARVGKKMVAGWYDRAAIIQLQRLAADKETTIQHLLGRALDLLFREEGLPPLAQSR